MREDAEARLAAVDVAEAAEAHERREAAAVEALAVRAAGRERARLFWEDGEGEGLIGVVRVRQLFFIRDARRARLSTLHASISACDGALSPPLTRSSPAANAAARTRWKMTWRS